VGSYPKFEDQKAAAVVGVSRLMMATFNYRNAGSTNNTRRYFPTKLKMIPFDFQKKIEFDLRLYSNILPMLLVLPACIHSHIPKDAGKHQQRRRNPLIVELRT